MSNDTMVEIKTTSGRTAKATLEELNAALASVAGTEGPKLRDIALVERKAKKVGVEWTVRWEWARSTHSGIPDRRDDGCISLDKPHPDLEAAQRDLTDKVVKLLMPGASAAIFRSVTWKEGTAVVLVEAHHPKLKKPVPLRCSLAEKTFSDEVFVLEREAFLYADQRKREQTELEL